METLIEQFETEAAEALRVNGEVVHSQAAQNLALALHFDLMRVDSAEAARYIINESLKADRRITDNLGALVCAAS